MSLVRRFYPHVNLKCIFRNSFTIGSLFSFKDRLPCLEPLSFTSFRADSARPAISVRQ